MPTNSEISANEPKRVILCADDYGISPGVSKGIVRLAEKQRISAVSVMVVYDEWHWEIRRLLNFRKTLDIGLHFTLTDSTPLSISNKILSLVNPDGHFPAVGQLIRRACSGQIQRREVLNELCLQYQRFVDFCGVAPDFIDGHHNVHQYPTIRRAVVEFLESKRIENPVYVRNTSIPAREIIRQGGDYLKSSAISTFGALFKALARNRGLPTNESFSGIYNLNRSELFETRLAHSLTTAKPGNGIIMTHPGISDNILAQRDSFNKGRELEFNFLEGRSFQKILGVCNVTLGKFEYINPLLI